MPMVVVVMMAVMVMVKVGHKNDAAMLVIVPLMVVIMAFHFFVKVESLRGGREADSEC